MYNEHKNEKKYNNGFEYARHRTSITIYLVQELMSHQDPNFYWQLYEFVC